jgi:dienelactone hydrolase
LNPSRPSSLAGFEENETTLLGETRSVFTAGDGPAVVVIHEAPGLIPSVADFGRRVVRAGHRVYMPSILGTPDRPMSIGYSIGSMARACVAREFATWATRRNSPITGWLRELGRHAHAECGGRDIGAVGMCLTGGFALAMMVDPWLLAPVLSQPSLPFGILPRQRRDLGIDDATLETVKQRATDEDLCVLGLRFTGDRMVPAERFRRLREELGDHFVAVEIDSSRGNPHDISKRAHSVLTRDYVDEPGHPTRAAFDEVIALFDRTLRAHAPTTIR